MKNDKYEFAVSMKISNTDDGSDVEYHSIKLEDDRLMVVLLPEAGGKMIELIDKQSGTQFLYGNVTDSFSVPEYRNVFDERYAYGFDECFPTVSPCTYQIDGRSINLPDHGELWARPWEYNQEENTVRLSTSGVEIDYSFSKHISLRDNKLTIQYELQNQEPFTFDYLWSSHPLLNIAPGDQLLFPEELSEVMVNWISDSELGSFGDKLPWPHLWKNKGQIDFSRVQKKSFGLAAKLFSDRLKIGRAGIYRSSADVSLIYEFDTLQIPYLGIWLCYGGWPEGTEEQQYTIAIEPASGRPDALDEAIKRKEASTIRPGEIKKWALEIDCVEGLANIQAVKP